MPHDNLDFVWAQKSQFRCRRPNASINPLSFGAAKVLSVKIADKTRWLRRFNTVNRCSQGGVKSISSVAPVQTSTLLVFCIVTALAPTRIGIPSRASLRFCSGQNIGVEREDVGENIQRVAW